MRAFALAGNDGVLNNPHYINNPANFLLKCIANEPQFLLLLLLIPAQSAVRHCQLSGTDSWFEDRQIVRKIAFNVTSARETAPALVGGFELIDQACFSFDFDKPPSNNSTHRVYQVFDLFEFYDKLGGEFDVVLQLEPRYVCKVDQLIYLVDAISYQGNTGFVVTTCKTHVNNMASRTRSLTFLLVFSVVLCVRGQKVVELGEENWSQILKGEWMVAFYAPWCPACKALEPRWSQFGRSGPALGIKIGAVDVTTSPGLSGRFMVTALPTIFHVLDGQFRQYKGARDEDSFSLFIEDRKWEQVEPISSWKAPDSLQMSVIAAFFRLSQSLRQIHNKFTNEYGLPTVASYLVFAVATIILGACLGLILVCVIDLLFPQKASIGKRVEGKKDKDSDNELNDEDIKDDLVDQDSEADSPSTESEGSQAGDKATGKARKRKAKRLDM
ncbi:thioredoxin-related transmembrane protein 1 [Dendroctonus ponderosae]|nr:thioredoxin-related transmembrane protein 1 [Dendroctonus ponderosae]KAH1008887.1 hypothetical protein HUJ05_009389 [Dendroctonus ponderosae]